MSTKKTIEVEIDGDLSFPSLNSLEIQGLPVVLTLEAPIVLGLQANLGGQSASRMRGLSAGEIKLKIKAKSASIRQEEKQVSAPLSFTSPGSFACKVGESVSFSISTNNEASSISLAGQLPDGLLFVGSEIKGTPTQAGDYLVRLSAVVDDAFANLDVLVTVDADA